MDALRKAELEKRKLGAAESADRVADLRLEPLAAPDAAAVNLPELPPRLEDLDEQFLAHAQSLHKPAAKSPAATAPQMSTPAGKLDSSAAGTPELARKLFDAKQPPRRPNRRFAIAVGTLSLVAVVGIGVYFWWQLQPKGAMLSGGTAMTPPASPPPPPAPSPAPPAVPAMTVATPVMAPAVANETSLGPDEEIPRARQQAPKPPPQAADAGQAPPLLRLTQVQQKPDVSLEQAHQAFSRGDHEQARNLWQKKLAADPLNADALQGLAALALEQRQPAEAANYYRRALEANPRNALALAALASLSPQLDPLQAESHFKTLLAEQPDSPYLNFALGNLYARGMRWPEAQQAYFRAHGADPANPDYLLNLAVSLDQMRQARLAAQYYARALAAAEQQSASFDPAQVAARLKILQASLLH